MCTVVRLLKILLFYDVFSSGAGFRLGGVAQAFKKYVVENRSNIFSSNKLFQYDFQRENLFIIALGIGIGMQSQNKVDIQKKK